MFVFAIVVAFFSPPSSAIVEAVPTVGGKVLAYAPPCQYEWWEYQQYGGEYCYNSVYLPAKDAYYDCLYG